MNSIRRVIAISLCISMTGCASMFHGTTETVYLRSNSTDITFFANGRELSTGSSAVTTIPKKDLKKTVLRASKPGCNDASSPIMTGFDGVSLLGCLIDFCIFTTLLIDWGINGATTKATQNDYILNPVCKSS